MKHKILTPDMARQLYATNSMADIQKAYSIDWIDLAFMLLHGRVRDNGDT